MQRLITSLVALSHFVLSFAGTASAALILYDDRSEFLSDPSLELSIEDWSNYPEGTLLEGQQVSGVSYLTTSDEDLVVGSSHGAGWLLGYAQPNDRYASFSSEAVSFVFSDPISAIGISLSQGNQSQGERFSGSSTWLIEVEGSRVFSARAFYDESDFSGETYLAVAGLGGITAVEVTRISSSAPLVWNIREVAFGQSVQVPEPTPSTLLLLGLLALPSLTLISRA